jgi:hypothetical protein
MWAKAVLATDLEAPLIDSTPVLIESAADAFASGSSLGIGGWFSINGHKEKSKLFWFSELYSLGDFPAPWNLVGDQAQRYIACFEVLAQTYLLVCEMQFLRGTAVQFSVPLQSDSVPTEGATNKLFTTSSPLKHFVQVLAAWCMTARIRPVVSHLGGERNHLADGLSRAKPDVVLQFDSSRRIEYSLAHIILQNQAVRLFPKNANWPDRVLSAAACVETALGISRP